MRERWREGRGRSEGGGGRESRRRWRRRWRVSRGLVNLQCR